MDPVIKTQLVRFSDIEPGRPAQRWWGDWYLDSEEKMLIYARKRPKGDESYRPNPDFNYCVYIDEMSNSAKTLDWIMQVANKMWATSEVVGDLVKAINDILQPQANLCSHGVDKTADSAKLVDSYVI